MKITTTYLKILLLVLLGSIIAITGILALVAIFYGIYTLDQLFKAGSIDNLLWLPGGLFSGILTTMSIDCMIYILKKWGWTG